jgi:hypothetical protein
VESNGSSHYQLRTVFTNGKCLSQVCRKLHCLFVLEQLPSGPGERAAASARVNKPLLFYMLSRKPSGRLDPECEGTLLGNVIALR